MNNQFKIAPLALALIGATLAGCGEDDNNSAAQGPSASELTFTAVAAPSTDSEKRAILTATAAADGVALENFGYHTFVRSGDVVDNVTFGALLDETGDQLIGEDGAAIVTNSNEYTSILQVGGKLFSVSQMESRPGAMFLMELNQDIKTGELSVKSMSQLDQSGIDGGWTHCAGSVTPWQTHLASEEYEPNARAIVTAADAAGKASDMMKYFKDPESSWNSYHYGYNIEVTVAQNGTATMAKHYSMGRLAFELAKVMPDQKTVFMSDDGTGVGFFMFVADKAGDLSAGNLYAAKWHQTSAAAGGAANLTWVNLGHATDAEIAAYNHGNNALQFTDMFETATPDAETKACAEGYASINAGGLGQECLKVKSGMEKAASRLETRRYAAVLGATTEFNKEEGITYDSKRNRLYVAMSDVAKGMEASGSANVGTTNDIQLNKNNCGTVFALDFTKDSNVGSDFVPNRMSALINGRPVTEADPQVAGFEEKNSCHINGIANPDNLTYMSGYDYLIIGEDTGSGHQNDVIWAYSFATSELIRLQTTPYGAETTSPYWYENINGWAYLTSVVQHPYGESDEDKSTGVSESRAYTGYVGPFPSPVAK